MDDLFDIQATIKVLKAGGTILYPTDTIWGIGCDATNSRAVNKIYRMKLRDPSKSLIVLVDSLDSLSRYVENIPAVAYGLMETIKEPLTIIYPRAVNLAKNAISNDGSVAIRIPGNKYCQALLQSFGKPITSTSANISGDPNPYTFSKISDKIKEMVDYVVNYREPQISMGKLSTIIKVTEGGDIQVIRN